MSILHSEDGTAYLVVGTADDEKGTPVVKLGSVEYVDAATLGEYVPAEEAEAGTPAAPLPAAETKTPAKATSV